MDPTHEILKLRRLESDLQQGLPAPITKLWPVIRLAVEGPECGDFPPD